MTPTPESSCIVCGTSAQRTMSKREFRYRICDACGHGWLDPLPAPDAAVALYDEDYFAGDRAGGYDDYARDESAHRANARARLSELVRLGLAPGGRVGDLGCAFGFGLDAWQQEGYAVVGADVSPAARAEAMRRFGLEVHPSSDSLATAEAGCLDAIGIFQALEHAADPRGLLRAAWRALRPGGILLVETWDRTSRVARLFGPRWQQLSPPAVVHLFSRASIEKMLAQEGFQDIGARPTRKRISAKFAVEQAGRAFPALARALGPMARRMPEAWGLDYAGDDLVYVWARRSTEPRR